MEHQLTTPEAEDPQELASLENVERLLRDCRDLLDDVEDLRTLFQPEGAAPVSSTARSAGGKTFTHEGFVPVSEPRALRSEEIAGVVAQYVHGARCAMEAGFDAVEILATGFKPLVNAFVGEAS